MPGIVNHIMAGIGPPQPRHAGQAGSE
jgi:hypothetical protein